MLEKENICPCCGRHCDLSEPHCERGREYIRTGVIPERKDRHGEHEHGHSHDEHRHGKEHSHIYGQKKSVRYTEGYQKMDTNNRLVINLRDLGHRVRFLFEGKGSQKRILIILNEVGAMTQRELTERIGVQPGSASEVLGKLENAGLIQRAPSEKDRRTTDIQLTDKGLEKAREAADNRKKRHQEMFSCLTEEERADLLALVEKLNADWDQRYDDEKEKNGRFCHKPRCS